MYCKNNTLLLFLIYLLFLTNFAFAQQKSIADIVYSEIKSNGIDAALLKYTELRQGHPEEYNFAESELNNLGYRLLGEEKLAEALRIFKLNTENFPQSPNVFDSYAEALMKNNQFTESINNYRNVIQLLSDSKLPENYKTFLEQNAKNKIAILQNPASKNPSNAISDFINENSEYPFGQLHPAAPPETEQWGKIVGVWECINHAKNNDQWVSGWPAIWAWKYILDGFAIQDIWLQDIKDLPPPNSGLGRHFVGTNIRIYDRFKKKWNATWFHNGQRPGGSGNATSEFEAIYQDNQIIMTPVQAPPEGQPKRRIVFHNMQKNSFDWKSETSIDDGKTWETQNKISATRFK